MFAGPDRSCRSRHSSDVVAFVFVSRSILSTFLRSLRKKNRSSILGRKDASISRRRQGRNINCVETVTYPRMISTSHACTFLRKGIIWLDQMSVTIPFVQTSRKLTRKKKLIFPSLILSRRRATAFLYQDSRFTKPHPHTTADNNVQVSYFEIPRYYPHNSQDLKH
jgi:hypothetical protein